MNIAFILVWCKERMIFSDISIFVQTAIETKPYICNIIFVLCIFYVTQLKYMYYICQQSNERDIDVILIGCV